MIRNGINIEGLTEEKDINIKPLSCVRVCEDKNNIQTNDNIEEIIQVSLQSQIDDIRTFNVDNKFILIFNGQTKFNILTKEPLSNNINFIDYTSYFSYTIDSPKREIKSLNFYIIDAFIKLLSENKIYYSLVYLASPVFEDEVKLSLNTQNKISINKEKYKYIDLESEFL